jgi:hypothetical protein
MKDPMPVCSHDGFEMSETFCHEKVIEGEFGGGFVWLGYVSGVTWNSMGALIEYIVFYSYCLSSDNGHTRYY